MLKKFAQKFSQQNKKTRNYMKHHFDDADFQQIDNKDYNLNFIILKEERNKEKETKEEHDFLNTMKLYKKNDYQIFPDHNELANHLLAKVKNFVKIISRPANKIIINDAQDSEEKSKDPNFDQQLFDELNLPEFSNLFTPEEKSNIQKVTTGVKQQIENIYDSFGGKQVFSENVGKDQKEKIEMLEAFEDIIKEQEGNLNK
eukprot:gene5794-9615_t